jgi:hypothetical protein
MDPMVQKNPNAIILYEQRGGCNEGYLMLLQERGGCYVGQLVVGRYMLVSWWLVDVCWSVGGWSMCVGQLVVGRCMLVSWWLVDICWSVGGWSMYVGQLVVGRCMLVSLPEGCMPHADPSTQHMEMMDISDSKASKKSDPPH